MDSQRKLQGSCSGFTDSSSNSVHDSDPVAPPALPISSPIQGQSIQDRPWSPCPSWQSTDWSPCSPWSSQSHQSWSNFGDLDPVVSLASQMTTPIRVQTMQDGSWSPCPSWAPSDWSVCPSWSPSQGSTNSHFSHPKGDEDYSPPHNQRPITPPPKSIADGTLKIQNQSSQIVRKSSEHFFFLYGP